MTVRGKKGNENKTLVSNVNVGIMKAFDYWTIRSNKLLKCNSVFRVYETNMHRMLLVFVYHSFRENYQLFEKLGKTQVIETNIKLKLFFWGL